MVDHHELQSTSYERMKLEGKFTDPIPNINPAGKSTALFEDTAERDLKPDVYFPLPATPDGERKYRKTYIPGQINVHWGLKEQKLPDAKFTYGVGGVKGESVQQTFKAGQKFGIEEYLNRRGEAIYHSTKREPLGRSFDRGHDLPGITKQSDFIGFGKKSADPEDGKLVIFPRGNLPDSEAIRSMYVKTHGNFAPGEMFSRNYEWPGAISEDEHFRFGAGHGPGGGVQEGRGAKMALDYEVDDEGSFPTTNIVRRTAEDYRHVNNDKLGKTKNMMQGKPPVKPGHAFGICSMGSDVSSGECIKGWYGIDEQLPDADLGRCVKPGRRNVTTETRAFGTPSVRCDIPGPSLEKRSVADTQNYGDEVGASALLNPQRFELQGVPDKEFLLRRPKDELESLLRCSGYTFGDGVYDELWKQSVKLFEDDLELASLDAFMFIYSDVINEEVKARLGAL